MTKPLPARKPKPTLESRRNFFRTGAAIAFGLGLPSTQWLTGCTQSADVSPIWNDLATRLQGSLLLPDAGSFIERATPWALQYASTLPQGIAICKSEADVQTCIQWAQANKIPLVARSGGHSYGGYSTTTGLMINVSSMTDIAYNPATKRATVGGGARNRHVFEAFNPLGLGITHGRCLEVGVAGLVLGGGIGFDMRAHGYTCDLLRETRIVLADGRALTCNDKENADLFWACRGAGGGNFGIHTSFTFETFPVNDITVFNIEWTERIPETFAALQTMVLAAPNSLGVKVSIVARKKGETTTLTLDILGQFAGSLADFNALLAPVLAVQQPASTTVSKETYWKGQAFISEEGKPEYAHERSRFVKGQLSPDAIRFIIDNLKAWPGTSKAATWKYFLLGGAIDDRKPTDMAFIHRGYPMLSSVELEWNESDNAALLTRNEQWLSNFHDQMEPHTSAHCYQNFIDPSQKDYLQAYYGSSLPQLQAVKRKYDPGNLFSYPQSIPL